MEQQVIGKMKTVLQDVLKLDGVDHINGTTRLFEDLNMDSTSSLELLIALEDVVPGLVIDPDTLDMRHFQTVGNLASYVQSNIAV